MPAVLVESVEVDDQTLILRPPAKGCHVIKFLSDADGNAFYAKFAGMAMPGTYHESSALVMVDGLIEPSSLKEKKRKKKKNSQHSLILIKISRRRRHQSQLLYR